MYEFQASPGDDRSRADALIQFPGRKLPIDAKFPREQVLALFESSDEKEIAGCLAALKATHAGTGFMHEAFDRNDAKRFTRKWFAWANTLFGELILTVAAKYPRLLRG